MNNVVDLRCQKKFPSASRIIIAELVSPVLQSYLESLGVKVREAGRKYVGSCPIHSGADNQSAFLIYPDGKVSKCGWACMTHLCHKKYKNDIIGLTQGILKCSEFDAVLKICEFLGVSVDDIKSNPEIEERIRFVAQTKKLRQDSIAETGWPRANIRAAMDIPSQYFLDRGFSREVLDECDVGTFRNKYENRVIVPIYDKAWSIMVGFTARTTKPLCEKCEKYHFATQNCPVTQLEEYNAAKWVTSTNFSLHNHLYNYWRAYKHILQNKYIVLTEGAVDCWRLMENGENCCLGLLGAVLTDSKMILLEKTGAYNLFIATDNDETGRKAAKDISTQCKRLFNIHILKYDTHDIGEMNSGQVHQLLSQIKAKL